MDLIVENIRSFVGKFRVPVRPITLLVGENSSGKSTLVACMAAAFSRTFPDPTDFNLAPFALGGFQEIVSYPARSGGEFRLGYDGLDEALGVRLEAVFTSAKGEPRVSQLAAETKYLKLGVKIAKQRGRGIRLRAAGKLQVKNSRGRPLVIETELPLFTGSTATKSSLLEFLVGTADRKLLRRSRGSLFEDQPIQEILQIARGPRPWRNIVALAPIRSQPQRTYTEARETFDPTGQHIPKLLYRLLSAKTAEGSKLRSFLTGFGKSSGLFKTLKPRGYGKAAAPPFQLQVQIASRQFSLADVGYGVSQALPLAVEAFRAPRGTMFLLQQPEVHLHPSAQAGLASIVVELCKTDQKSFVLETHSDHIVDRVRQHIRSKDIDVKDVSLLFLERVGDKTSVHEIELGADGTPINAPAAYRRFFIAEQLKLL